MIFAKLQKPAIKCKESDGQETGVLAPGLGVATGLLTLASYAG